MEASMLSECLPASRVFSMCFCVFIAWVEVIESELSGVLFTLFMSFGAGFWVGVRGVEVWFLEVERLLVFEGDSFNTFGESIITAGLSLEIDLASDLFWLLFVAFLALLGSSLIFYWKILIS